MFFFLGSLYDIAYLVFFKSSQLSSQVFAKHGFASVYNILLLVKYFCSRTKCAFVLGGDSQQSVPGGLDDMVLFMLPDKTAPIKGYRGL